jgi:hypothetical protein
MLVELMDCSQDIAVFMVGVGVGVRVEVDDFV